MSVASFCIKHKVTTIMAFVVISVFGLTIFSDLKLTLLPEINYPAAYIACYYNGAGPEDVEELVTRPLESVVATIPGVKTMDSSSGESMSTVIIEYEDGTDVEEAATKLREKFDQLTLPEGCNEPIIYNMNVNDFMPVAAIAIVGEDMSKLQRIAEKEITPALERINGVAAVNLAGGLDSQITVAVDSARLSGYGLSIDYISNYLKGVNVLYPGGDVKNGVQALTVSSDGKLRSVSDVANTVIPTPTGGFLRLGEVANVYLEEDKQDTVARANDQDCVILTISKQSNANEVETAKEVKAALEKLKTEEGNFDYIMAYDSSEYILRTANNAVSNIVMGVLLAAVIVFLFLRRPGATMTIAVSMPFCILAVFVVMKLCNITLNMISLGGIAMGVGMIVDNSIVVLENIYRFAGDGHSRYDACVKGTQEVTLAITASTLTTVVVFLPIGLSGGLSGMLFKDFSLTVAFLLLASLVISLTLVPLLCYFLLDETKVRQRRLSHDEKAPPFAGLFAATRSRYLKLLDYFIHKRYMGVIASLVMVGIFIASCATTDVILMPDVDQGEVTVSVEMPLGTELEDTMATAERVVSLVKENTPELDTFYYSASSDAGGGMGMGGSPGTASFTATLVGKDERDRSSKEVAGDLRRVLQDIPGCEITVSANSMSAMAGGGSDIYVEVEGDDYETLSQIAYDLKAQIAAIPGAVNLSSSVEDAKPAVKVNVRQDNASMYGLTPVAIGMAVRAELTGATATSITVDGNDIDVVIKGDGAASASLDSLRAMPVTTPTGGQVPLSAVADVDVELTPQNIARHNQSRQVSISGEIEGVELTDMTAAIQEVIDNYQMPEGYSAKAGGTYEDMTENFSDLILALVVALGLVYFVLSSQFESFIMPIIVMMILPIALSGALFGLPLTGNDISIIAVIGLIMLSGVVVNASIILVDYIKIRRILGETREEAILHACPLRIRPIMMTTLTTILAMVPMALGYGDGAEMMQPMAVVMISGMIIATIVTLVFTPVYYSLLDSLTVRINRLFTRKRKAVPEEEVTPVN